MPPAFNVDTCKPLPSNLPCRFWEVDAEAWRTSAETMRADGCSLLTLWGSDDRDRDGCFRIFAAYVATNCLWVVQHNLDASNPIFPSLADAFPAAQRMERAVWDLLGIASTAGDHRGWLRHGGWPEDFFPLRRDVDRRAEATAGSGPYEFLQVGGEGVHEIAVGPVHAGTIEPGHFRFSVVGEKVLRLEERLGYKHKGIAKRFEQMSLADGSRLAARISGDSAVAYTWAYCSALEAITQTTCPERALQLRALALEHERIANHLGDLGALGNDAGFAFGLTQFSRMKEDLLRLNQSAFSARYLLDLILPGGVTVDLSREAMERLLGHYVILQEEVASLRQIYENHAGVQDRFREAGVLSGEVAIKLDATGLAARASGIARDLRVELPWPPYDRLEVRSSTQISGDVSARVAVRFEEIFEGIRLCRVLIENLAGGPILESVPEAVSDRLGIGVIEGWRGPVAIVLEAGPQDSIRRCHFHDPSWQNWPLLEHAIHGNIVPDFPLINKSFNLSYSGHDG